MDALSSIFTWLSDHGAGISAVVGIAVTARDSTDTYKGRASDVIQMSQQLGARSTYGLRQFGAKE
jgi:hypothetical protein